MNKRVSWVAIVLLGLGACGDSGDDSGNGGEGATSPDGGREADGGSSSGGRDDGGAPSGGSAAGGGDEGGAGAGEVGGGDQGGGGEGGGPSGPSWTTSEHTCSATSRTDALWIDDNGTFWVGCGTTQVGYGLHRSDDGLTWQQVETSPEDDMAQFRVSVIQRGANDNLFVAGYDANDRDMVLRLDTSAEPYAITKILTGVNQVGRNFHVGSFALLPQGRIFVESLTGYGALFRSGAAVGSSASMWTDAYYWAADGDGYQMMDLALASDGKLYGSGSTISEPPMLFLPPTDPDAPPYELIPLELPNDGWSGEMWGVAADDGKVVVTGVDQVGDIGKIYVSGADIYDTGDYTEIDIDTIVGSGGLGTWGRGACIAGDRVAVVGERQPLGGGSGLVMLSTDGGQTFQDITPEDVGESVTRCKIMPDGSLVVTGASSFFGIYR